MQTILKSIFFITLTMLLVGINVAKADMALDPHRLFISFEIQGENKDSFSYSITKEPVEDDHVDIDYAIQNAGGNLLYGHSPVPAVISWSSTNMGYLRTMRITITNDNLKKEIYSAEVFYYPIKRWTKIQVEQLDPAYSVAQSRETVIDVHANQIVPSLRFTVIHFPSPAAKSAATSPAL